MGSRVTQVLVAVGVAAAAAILAGCGGGSAQQVCVPGISNACVCPDGQAASQFCNAEGTGYGACVCGELDAGIADASMSFADAGADAPAGDATSADATSPPAADAAPDATSLPGPDAGAGCDLQTSAGCAVGFACHLTDEGWTYCLPTLPSGEGNSGAPCVTDADCTIGQECQGGGFNRQCHTHHRLGSPGGGLESSAWTVGYEELGYAYFGGLDGVSFKSCHLTGPFAGICSVPTETCTPTLPPHIYMGEEWGVCR